MNARCRVQLLGALQIHRGDQSIGRFRTYKAGVLLGFLATYRHRPHAREEIVGMLWPEVDEALGRNSLSQCLSSLRSQLEPAGVESGSVLIADRLNIQLNPEAVSTDRDDFLESIKLAERLKAAVPPDPSSFAALGKAVELYSGDFLPGYYEAWNLGERERLKSLYVDSLMELVEHYESLGDLPKALGSARNASMADPLREDLHQAVIRSCLALGDFEGAKKQYRMLKTIFRRDLGLEPSQQTRSLFKIVPETAPDEPALRVSPPTFPVSGPLTLVVTSRKSARPTAEFELKIEGEFAVAAFSRPSLAAEYAMAIQGSAVAMSTSESTSAALDRCLSLIANAPAGRILCTPETALLLEGLRTSEFPTQPGAYLLFREGEDSPDENSAISKSGDDSQLPLRLSRFFGRTEEERGILKVLAEGCRLVTVTGPGGIGKTRLAIETASRQAKEVGGIAYFVDLAEVQSSDGIAAAIAVSLGIPTVSKRDPIELIEARLKSESNLLILDNFEQLLPEEGTLAHFATQKVSRILQSCPGSQIIVTSRKRLGIEGESEFPVGPLNVPDPDADHETRLDCESVRLFIDRAQIVRPDLKTTESHVEAIASLCRSLDGMPLAIELAAARSQVLSPSQILERMLEKLDLLTSRSKGVPDRHKTLRNAVDWSYRMLSPQLQDVFRMLSVLRGGFDVQAAEAMTMDPLALDKLADLREFSLISSEDGPAGTIRFRMLETLRDFAQELQSDAERKLSLDRHADYFAKLAMEAEPHLTGGEQSLWLDRLQADHENLISALQHSVAKGDAETALRLCVGIWRFWFVRGHLTEGRRHMAAVLECKDSSRYPELVGKVLNGIGRLAYLQGDYEEGTSYHEQALALCRTVKDRDGEALAVNALGSIAYEQGDYERAHALYKETLAIRRELGEEFGLANILNWLGIVLTDQCRYDEATEHLLESLDLRIKIGDHGGRARSLNSLGIIARQTGDFERAQRLFAESLEIQLQLGDRRAIAAVHSNLGLVALNLKQFEEASAQFAKGMDSYKLLGDKWGTATLSANMGNLARAQGDLDRAIRLLQDSLRTRMELKNLWGVAYSLQGLAACAVDRGKLELAIKLQAAAKGLRDLIGSPLPPVEQAQWDKEIEATRAQVSSAKFEAAWEMGAALDADSATKLALGSL